MEPASYSTFTFLATGTTKAPLRHYRHWTRAYCRPRWLQVDASQTNFGETLAGRRRDAVVARSWKSTQSGWKGGAVGVDERYFENIQESADAKSFVNEVRVAGMRCPRHGSREQNSTPHSRHLL